MEKAFEGVGQEAHFVLNMPSQKRVKKNMIQAVTVSEL